MLLPTDVRRAVERANVATGVAAADAGSFTDAATLGVPIDLGAHWLHSPALNPLAKEPPRMITCVAMILGVSLTELPSLALNVESEARALTTQTQIYHRWQSFFSQYDVILAPSITTSRSRPGVSANRGTVRALPTMVKRAPGISSTRVFTSPEESTASPIRLEVMKRIEKGLGAMRMIL